MRRHGGAQGVADITPNPSSVRLLRVIVQHKIESKQVREIEMSRDRTRCSNHRLSFQATNHACRSEVAATFHDFNCRSTGGYRAAAHVGGVRLVGVRTNYHQRLRGHVAI